jgi:hypothetical protein
MIIVPRRHQYPSSGANIPSDVSVTVNFNAEYNPMPVNPIIECVARDLAPEYYQSLDSSVGYTVPPLFIKSLHGRPNRSQPRLPLYMDAAEFIPTSLMSNIYIGLSLPKALTLTTFQLYEMFEVLVIVRINRSIRIQGILNFCLL